MITSSCRPLAHRTKNYCIRLSMNQPNWHAAEGSACASWRRVGMVVPGALVKKWFQLSNITVSLALKPNKSSVTPAMFCTRRANSKKSRGIVKPNFVIFLMSLSESPVVVSVVFNCILIRLFVCLSAFFPPEEATSITCGPQQNKLNAPGRSVAPEVKVPVRIAAQTPEAICTSKFFECRKKLWM